MTKRTILLFIPLAIIAGSIIYSWIKFIGGEYDPRWQHYLAPVLIIPALYFLFKKDLQKAHLATAIYLVVGMCLLISLEPGISWTKLTLFGITTPPFNFYSFIILLIYLVLNCYTLMNFYLDYRESKRKL